MTTTCPHCGGAISPAALLAAMAAGKPKRFSGAERKRRAARLAEARKSRWPRDGHVWRPTVPGESVCVRCGTIRTTSEDGTSYSLGGVAWSKEPECE